MTHRLARLFKTASWNPVSIWPAEGSPGCTGHRAPPGQRKCLPECRPFGKQTDRDGSLKERSLSHQPKPKPQGTCDLGWGRIPVLPSAMSNLGLPSPKFRCFLSASLLLLLCHGLAVKANIELGPQPLAVRPCRTLYLNTEREMTITVSLRKPWLWLCQLNPLASASCQRSPLPTFGEPRLQIGGVNAQPFACHHERACKT